MTISSGSLGIDALLKNGWERGAIVEVWGASGTGKTTLAQHAVSGLHPDDNALWISVGTERPHRAMRASIVSPRTAEETFSVMGAALQLGAKFIVVDSANGLVRSREIEGSGDYQPFWVPSPHREYKPELTRLKDATSIAGGTVLFLSKPRDRERAPIRGTGVSEKASQRVTLKIVKSSQDGSRLIEASIKTGESCEYILRPGSGIDWAEELLRTCLAHGIVTARGSWWNLPGKVIQGKEAAVEYIREYPGLAAALNAEARECLRI